MGNQLKELQRLIVQSKYDEAILFADKILFSIGQNYGENHPAFPAILDKMGDLYQAKGDYANAELLFLKAAEMYRRMYGDFDPDYYAVTLEKIGMLYFEMASYSKAEPLFLEAQEIFGKVVGIKNSHYVSTIDHLAKMYHNMKHYTKAEFYFLHEIDVCRTILGEVNHINFAIIRTNLAEVYRAKHDYTKAEKELNRALEIHRITESENHPNFPTVLNNLAFLFLEKKDYDKAKDCFVNALKSYRIMHMEESPNFASTLNNLGFVFLKQYDYTKAEEYFAQALEIKDRTIGKYDIDYVDTLNDLGSVSLKKANYSKAEDYFKQALDLGKKINDGSHIAYIDSLRGIAITYEHTGDYSKAEEYFKQALDLKKKVLGHNEPEDYSIFLNDLGTCRLEMGDYIKAEEYLKQALEIMDSGAGRNSLQYAKALYNLSQIYLTNANSSKAEKYAKQALEIMDSAAGRNSPEYATVLYNLGSTCQSIGDYIKAEEYFKQALEIIGKTLGKSHPEYACRLTPRGMLYHVIGDYIKAEEYFNEALEIIGKTLGKSHPEYIISLNGLARISEVKDDLTVAEQYYLEALELGSSAVVKGDQSLTIKQSVAITLDNLATLHYDTGDMALAQTLFHRALEIWHQIQGEKNHPATLRAMKCLGLIYQRRGDYTKAEEYFNEALEISSKAGGDSQGLIMMAELKVRKDDQKEALALFNHAAIIDNAMIANIFPVVSDRSRMAYIERTLRVHLYQFLSFVIQHYSSSQEAVHAAADLVLRRKAIGLEAILSQQSALLGDKYPDLKEKLYQLNNVRDQISQKELSRIDELSNVDLAGLNQSLKELKESREDLEIELSRNIGEIKLQRLLRSTTIQDIANTLPQGTALIEFIQLHVYNFTSTDDRPHWKDPHYIAFVLRGAKPTDVSIVDLGEVYPIDNLIAKFRRSFQDVTYRNTISCCGYALRKILFDPLLNVISSANQLLIAPDGELTRLPFGLLPLDEGKHLIQDYSITYLNSGRDLVRLSLAHGGGSSDPVVAANPNFDLKETKSTRLKVEESHSSRTNENEQNEQDIPEDLNTIYFPQLEKTQIEGELIGNLLGVKPLTRDEVLESEVRARKSPQILHLATHGFFFASSPQHIELEELNTSVKKLNRGSRAISTWTKLSNPLLRSCIALAGANTRAKGGELPKEAGDGILTAEDVTSMDLTNTELVVLSACETGLGDVHTGEGVFGLRRAFVIAGAQTLVMSLWKVPDEQTRELMSLFYEYLLEGQSRSDALRNSQMAMRERYPDNPEYWGAFICQGDANPLSDGFLSQTRARNGY